MVSCFHALLVLYLRILRECSVTTLPMLFQIRGASALFIAILSTFEYVYLTVDFLAPKAAEY